MSRRPIPASTMSSVHCRMPRCPRTWPASTDIARRAYRTVTVESTNRHCMILPLHEALKSACARDSRRYARPGRGCRRDHCHRDAAEPDAGRPRDARRLRARPPPAQGAARDRAGNRRALRPDPGIARVEAAPNGYLNVFLDRPAFLLHAARRAGAAAGAAARQRARPSSSTRRSTRTRRRTSATCATRRSAIRSCACCASAARRSKFRTTSTTPASRSPTWSSASASSSSVDLDGGQALADRTRFDYYCWDLYARVTEWYEQDKERLKMRARRCTTSSTAPARPPTSPRSSPIASSAAT